MINTEDSMNNTKAKRALLFSACAFQNPHSGMMLEEAEELMASGFEVHFCYCSGILDSCFCNPHGNRAVCAICKWCQRRLLVPYRNRMRIVPLGPSDDVRDMPFEYSDNESIKKLKYKNVLVGYGALSNYVSLTRNAAPRVDDGFRAYFDHQLNVLCAYVDCVEKVFDDVSPDMVSFVTGRNAEQRPFLDLAKSRDIHVRCNEFVGNPSDPGMLYKIVFEDELPHNVMLNHRLIEKVWGESEESEDKKYEIGRSFYENRASGAKLNTLDLSFTSRFKDGALPANLDPSRKHLVIFNSSEDEFVSVGSEFDSYAVFPSQLEGIVALMEALKDSDYQVFLRIHPNLTGIDYPFHTDIYDLGTRYDNLTIIPPDSPVSSYALLEVSDKVVVFGSTMGVESAYRGKPTILLAGAFYSHLDVCYAPTSAAEAISLALDPELPPKKNVLGAIKYGYYIQRQYTLGHAPKYVDIRNMALTPRRIFGSRARYGAYMKLWGSRRAMAYVLKKSLHLARKFFDNSLKAPDEMFIFWFK